MIGNVCYIGTKLCVIYEVKDDLCYAVTFDGERMVSNCPTILANTIHDYVNMLKKWSYEHIDTDEVMR
jgi:hypothetical protein